MLLLSEHKQIGDQIFRLKGRKFWVQRYKQGSCQHLFWSDTLSICENMSQLSPWLLYLLTSLVHPPASQRHLSGIWYAEGIAVGDCEC